VLPPRALLALALREGAMLSGTELSGFPRRALLDISCSGGGEAARSLIGDTLRDCGRSGDILRTPRAARPGSAFHCVSFEGDGATFPKDNLFAVIGVDSSFAMSNGLKPAPEWVEIDGRPSPRDGTPGLAVDTFGGVWPCGRGPVGVCGATANGCSITPPGAPG
jgi:hypothetical protein